MAARGSDAEREAGTVLGRNLRTPARASTVRAGGLKGLRFPKSRRPEPPPAPAVLIELAFRLHSSAYGADCQIAAGFTAVSTKG